MYSTLRDGPPPHPPDAASDQPRPARRPAGLAVAPVVLMLGLTSMLTDLSTEMVTAVLPLYLVLSLGFSPLQVGVVNGLYQGVTALVRLAGGVASDRLGRHRDVAAAGYALSVLSRLALLVPGGSAAVVSGSIVTDRVGKGIRTAPRDALLSLAATENGLGVAFGVHRAMDTFGAMLGPVAAFAVLSTVPGSYRLVFAVSACAGVVGLAVLVFFVDRHPAPEAAAQPGSAAGITIIKPSGADGRPGPSAPAGTAAPSDIPAQPAMKMSLRDMMLAVTDRRLRRILVAGCVLALATIGDAFIYLRMQQTLEITPTMFPLLAAGTSGMYLLTSVPLGRLADRIGRARVFLGGFGALLGVYVTLLSPLRGMTALLCCLGFLGLYYAATDGVLSALTSAALPAGARTTGLALVQSGVSLGQLAASAAFGALWTAAGVETALTAAAVLLAVALAIAWSALRRTM
ncbi:MFS transporter [Frankia sp. CiP3]|uniref:MFS transporter n=1 Tax=Frankia sp. CiP3 TaxID=2880971 RepID=UPI001EF71296|nr:MFS transporter [Frankia sp. CiP3]